MAAVNTEDGSESGVSHSPQEEVADLRRQVGPFAVDDISKMKVLCDQPQKNC
jgi:hypothetical protein